MLPKAAQRSRPTAIGRQCMEREQMLLRCCNHLKGGHNLLGNLTEVVTAPNSQSQRCEQEGREAAMTQVVGVQIQLMFYKQLLPHLTIAIIWHLQACTPVSCDWSCALPCRLNYAQSTDV